MLNAINRKNGEEIILILDNIRSAQNVGSIFRTADAAGVGKIYLCGITPIPELKNCGLRTRKVPWGTSGHLYGITDLQKKSILNSQFVVGKFFNKKISKTALGAENFVEWEYRPQTWRLLKKLKKEGSQIVALEQDKKSIDYRKFKPKGPIVLILGNEVRGLSGKILKYADKIIAIPMYGRKESLNVSVAAGIVLFKIRETERLD